MAHIILVHGAMHGAWCWEHIVPLLAARGHTVRAIDLPGLGDDTTPPDQVTPDDWPNAVAAAARAAPCPVVLVGHSMGGTAIAQAAERAPDHVAGLVFLSAIMIRGGETIASACPEVAEIAIRETQATGGYSRDGTIRMFYGTTDPQTASAAIARLRPQPTSVVVAPISVTDGNFGRLPRAYIECMDDGIVPLAVQRRMQQSWPCDPVITLPGDHSPFFSAPAVLAAHLDRIARRFAPSDPAAPDAGT